MPGLIATFSNTGVEAFGGKGGAHDIVIADRGAADRDEDVAGRAMRRRTSASSSRATPRSRAIAPQRRISAIRAGCDRVDHLAGREVRAGFGEFIAIGQHADARAACER